MRPGWLLLMAFWLVLGAAATVRAGTLVIEAGGPTIRFNAQVLDRGRPGMESEMWHINTQVLHGSLAPREAAARLQEGFARRTAPGQNSVAPACSAWGGHF